MLRSLIVLAQFTARWAHTYPRCKSHVHARIKASDFRLSKSLTMDSWSREQIDVCASHPPSPSTHLLSGDAPGR